MIIRFLLVVKLYSRGGLSPQIISQYLDVFGDLTICSHSTDVPERYVTLAPKDVQHIDFPDVLGKDLSSSGGRIG